MTAAVEDGRPLSALNPTYFEASRRPLAATALLLPFIVFHELAVLFGPGATGGPAAETVAAYRIIERTLSSVGAVALATPGILCLIVLLAAHFVARHPWRLPMWIPAVMLVESLVWAVVLFAAQASAEHVLLAATVGGSAAAGVPGGDSLLGQLTLAFGAGLYEELLFRALLVGAGMLVLRRVAGMSERTSAMVAVGVSAVLFALYHDVAGSGVVDAVRLFFVYAAGGVFLGLLYVARGLGIAAAAHAIYDVLVIALLVQRAETG